MFNKSGGDSNDKPTAISDHGRWPEANVGLGDPRGPN